MSTCLMTNRRHRIRYMIGGKPSKPLKERLYSFEFPEYPGALIKFLDTLGTHWNISLFNYRNHMVPITVACCVV
ncbi:hypothetical protein O9992_09115 [Vibrio lentus]|nr:hypothetical protein [Vibrio lentus]